MSDILKERRLINLNSEDATFKNNGTFLSNVVFNFSNILKEERDVVYVEGGVLNAQIPVSFYAVNIYNNVLFYSLNSTIFSITIPVGNYNFTTFASALVARFLANGHTMVITINQTKGIITFTNSTGTLNFFQETGSTCWRVLGFATGSGNYNAVANVLTPPHLLNLLGPKKLKIFCEAFSISSMDSKNYSTSTLIDTISIDVPSYSQLNYTNQTGEYGRLKKKEISNIDILICDELNQPINFNNTDWSLTLALIIFRQVEITNSDLQPLLNTLGNVENILMDIDSNFKNQNMQEPTNQQTTEEIPLEEQPVDNLEQNTGYTPPTLETDDLDLLLYENPNVFK
jgi:hypothetical protein